MRLGYSTPLVIAIMAFAIVAFLFLIDTAINPDGTTKNTNSKNTNQVACTQEAKICPDGSAVGRSGPKCEFAACPDGASNSNISTNTSTNTSEILPTNVARFTSTKLGITFTYLTTAKDYKAEVKEIGDKVYINTNVSATNPITNGQWVQVFPKDPADSLAQAITKRFLSGISTKDCFVTIQSRDNISSTQSAAIIDWPATLIDEQNPFGDNSKCPKEYQKTNGERYFLVDSQDATKLLFFSIGQYAIMGLNDNSTTWQQTLRVTKTDSTADWKTYQDTKYHFSIKYPSTWTNKLYKDGYNNQGSYVVAFTPDQPLGPLPFISVKENWTVAQEVTRINSIDEFTKVESSSEKTIGTISGTAITYSTAIGSTPTSFCVQHGKDLYIFNSYPNQTNWNTLIGSLSFSQ